MTKFFATVCLPPTAPSEVPEAIAAVMAPYDFDLPGDWNPAGQWDWWRIHADMGKALLALPHHDGDGRLLTSASLPREKAALDALGPLECYGGPRRLLDFEAMRRRAARPYDALLAFWQELAAAHEPARPLAEFVGRHEADPTGYPLAEAEREHRAQPLVRELARRSAAGDLDFATEFLPRDPVAYFAHEHEEARKWAVRCAVPGSALIGPDGAWTDADCAADYWERANDCLDGLDEEAVVVDLLCHC